MIIVLNGNNCVAVAIVHNLFIIPSAVTAILKFKSLVNFVKNFRN